MAEVIRISGSEPPATPSLPQNIEAEAALLGALMIDNRLVEDVQIRLDASTVSRRHAVVGRGDAGFTIEDLGSLNGTFLNRSRIERGNLENGDEVQISKYRLIFLAR